MFPEVCQSTNTSRLPQTSMSDCGSVQHHTAATSPASPFDRDPYDIIMQDLPTCSSFPHSSDSGNPLDLVPSFNPFLAMGMQDESIPAWTLVTSAMPGTGERPAQLPFPQAPASHEHQRMQQVTNRPQQQVTTGAQLPNEPNPFSRLASLTSSQAELPEISEETTSMSHSPSPHNDGHSPALDYCLPAQGADFGGAKAGNPRNQPRGLYRQVRRAEQMVAELQAQIRALELQNRRLRTREDVLGAVIAVRDQQLAALTGADMQSQPMQPHPTAALLDQPTYQSAASEPNAEPLSLGRELFPIQTINQHLQAVLSGTRHSSSMPHGQRANQSRARTSHAGTRTTTNVKSTQDEVLTDQGLQWTFCQFVQDAAQLVVAWDALPTPALAAQLQTLVTELMQKLHGVKFLSNQQVMMRNTYLNLTTGAHDFPGDQLWRGVARQLKCSRDQVECCRALVSSWEDCICDTRVAKDTLSTAVTNKLDLELLTSSISEHTHDEMGFELMQLTEELSAVMAREQTAMTQVCEMAWFLTPDQIAKMLVASFPYVPDLLAVANAVVAVADGTCPSPQ